MLADSSPHAKIPCTLAQTAALARGRQAEPPHRTRARAGTHVQAISMRASSVASRFSSVTAGSTAKSNSSLVVSVATPWRRK